MAIEVNGVTLPDIPVVEGYPYATVITVEESGETVKAVFLAAVSEILYIPPELNGTEFGLITHMTPGDIVYEWTPATNEWQLYAESTDVQQNYPCGNVDGTDYSITWANHNIAVVGLGTDGAPYATDEIYFPSSVVAEPKYGKIRRQIVRDIANSIRSKTGNTAKLTPEQMASEIDGIATIDELYDDEAVEITSNATTIPRYIFYKNSTLKTINLPRCTCVKQNAFNEATTLTTVNAPNCTSIDMNAFKGCKNLNNINLPSLVTLGVNAFSACSNLKYVDLPLCTSLKNSVFQQCTSLVSVIAPSVSVIDQYAFYNCTNVKLIDLSSCVTLNNQALYYTKNLSALVLRSEEICILQSVNAFQISSIASGTGYIYVPSALIDSYKVATNWSTYANQFRAIEDYPDICGV